MNRVIEASPSPFARLSGWNLAVSAFLIATITLLACYWQTMQSLVWVWEHDGTYQYAFLIFPLSVWLAFNLRHRVRENPPMPSIWGLVAVALLVTVWYAGHLLDINLAQHFAFATLFPAMVLACLGWRALWILVFPLSYLVVFSVPWGNGLVGPLQDITAHLAIYALDLTGMPALLEGRRIVTPIATWMVADACSGVKFFIASSALGCLYAYLMYQRPWKRVLFVLLASVVPIFANGLRVYFTIMIGEIWGMKYATGTDHMIFGWQFFGTVLVLLLLAGWFFRDPLLIRKHPISNSQKPAMARSVIWVATSMLLIAGPVLASALTIPVDSKAIKLTVPEVAGWMRSQAVGGSWRPIFKGSMGKIHASYQATSNGNVVELFHAVYTGKPRRGHNLITYGNDAYDPAQSQILSNGSQALQLANGQRVTAKEMTLAGPEGLRLVWLWYCVDRHCTGSKIMVKLAQAWDVLSGREPLSSVWAISSSISQGGAADARSSLARFAKTLPGTELMPTPIHGSSSGNDP